VWAVALRDIANATGSMCPWSQAPPFVRECRAGRHSAHSRIELDTAGMGAEGYRLM
jgi:hypothetical protein